jgi:hypothetical protein
MCEFGTCIWLAWRSMVMMWSAPATLSMFATSSEIPLLVFLYSFHLLNERIKQCSGSGSVICLHAYRSRFGVNKQKIEEKP